MALCPIGSDGAAIHGVAYNFIEAIQGGTLVFSKCARQMPEQPFMIALKIKNQKYQMFCKYCVRKGSWRLTWKVKIDRKMQLVETRMSYSDYKNKFRIDARTS